MEIKRTVIQVHQPGDTLWTVNKAGGLRAWTVEEDGHLNALATGVELEKGMKSEGFFQGEWRP